MTTEPTLDHLRLRLGRELFDAARADSEARLSRLTPRLSFEAPAAVEDRGPGDHASGDHQAAVAAPESPVDPGHIH